MALRGRHLGRVLLGAGLALALLTGTASAGVPNNSFGNAWVLSGETPAPHLGSNVGADTQANEPDPGFSVTNSTWYRWTSSYQGPAQADTRGSSFDTELAVYTGGPAITALTLLDANDDAQPFPERWSRVEFEALKGVTYYFQMDGYVGATGSTSIRVNRVSFNDVAFQGPFWIDVEWAAGSGVAQGFGDGGFHPSANVSRAAMSAFLYRLAGRPTFVDPPTATFQDVPLTHPFFTEIEWMNDEGITTGYPGGFYKPGAPVTRGAMSAFLYRLAGEPLGPFDDPGFTDVPSGSQFRTAIHWMASEEITGGYQDNTFRPTATVRRNAMAAFMHRYSELDH